MYITKKYKFHNNTKKINEESELKLKETPFYSFAKDLNLTDLLNIAFHGSI
jgi:hypothetical protein